MALHIKGKGIGETWQKLLRTLHSTNNSISPRGIQTREILNIVFEVSEGLDNIIYSKERDLNYRFMVAEWIWILGGLKEVGFLAKYNKHIEQFSDDGQILSGAYGPRIMPQIPYIINCLKKDQNSRQAVVTIWTPNPLDSKDIPCSISLQWLIRDEKIHTTVNMRSSDVFLGLPYDFFTFSQITNYISSILKFDVGSITFNLGSSHLYEKDYEKTNLIISSKVRSIYSPYIPNGISFPFKDIFEGILTNSQLQGLWEPWKSYSESLKIGKLECLEILKRLSPCRIYEGLLNRAPKCKEIWEEFNNSKRPDNYCICHSCDNPRCQSPYHLFLGTYKDNSRDSVIKGRHRGGWCNPKLTNELVLEIRNNKTKTIKQWADELKISYPTIHRAKSGITWRHLNEIK